MDSMRARVTESVEAAIKSTNSIPAVIPGGPTKYPQPLDISVNRAFKVHEAWESWMTSGEKSFAKTGHKQRPSLNQVCQWILNAWSWVKTLIITNGFRKAGLIHYEEDGEYSSDIENEENDVVSDKILRMFNSDTEVEGFDGFSAQEEDEEGDQWLFW